MPSVRDLVAVIEERAIRSRIKQARKEAGLTQEQISELIGVDDRTYQNYEREDEKGRTPWRLMNAISAATGKQQEWLLHGDAPDLMGALNGNDGPAALADQIASEFKAALLPIERRLYAIEEALEKVREETSPAQTAPVGDADLSGALDVLGRWLKGQATGASGSGRVQTRRPARRRKSS